MLKHGWLVAVLICANVYAQDNDQVWQHEYEQSAFLEQAVSFNNKIVALGPDFTMSISDDNGATWRQPNSPFPIYFDGNTAPTYFNNELFTTTHALLLRDKARYTFFKSQNGDDWQEHDFSQWREFSQMDGGKVLGFYTPTNSSFVAQVTTDFETWTTIGEVSADDGGDAVEHIIDFVIQLFGNNDRYAMRTRQSHYVTSDWTNFDPIPYPQKNGNTLDNGRIASFVHKDGKDYILYSTSSGLFLQIHQDGETSSQEVLRNNGISVPFNLKSSLIEFDKRLFIHAFDDLWEITEDTPQPLTFGRENPLELDCCYYRYFEHNNQLYTINYVTKRHVDRIDVDTLIRTRVHNPYVLSDKAEAIAFKGSVYWVGHKHGTDDYALLKTVLATGEISFVREAAEYAQILTDNQTITLLSINSTASSTDGEEWSTIDVGLSNFNSNIQDALTVNGNFYARSTSGLYSGSSVGEIALVSDVRVDGDTVDYPQLTQIVASDDAFYAIMRNGFPFGYRWLRSTDFRQWFTVPTPDDSDVREIGRLLVLHDNSVLLSELDSNNNHYVFRQFADGEETATTVELPVLVADFPKVSIKSAEMTLLHSYGGVIKYQNNEFTLEEPTHVPFLSRYNDVFKDRNLQTGWIDESSGDAYFWDPERGLIHKVVRSAELLDRDGDGISDEHEAYSFTYGREDEGDLDSDNDGLTSRQEAVAGTRTFLQDTDSDGMTDGYEVNQRLNPRNALDAIQDPDNDGLTNLQEFELNSQARNPDSDNDGVSDSDELALGTDLLNADSDGDGVSDGEEIAIGTDPLNRDSDGDGRSDGYEVVHGSNPLVIDEAVGESECPSYLCGSTFSGWRIAIFVETKP